jgi:hypothetical protein
MSLNEKTADIYYNLILVRFLKQAVPFSNIPGHSAKPVFDLIAGEKAGN